MKTRESTEESATRAPVQRKESALVEPRVKPELDRRFTDFDTLDNLLRRHRDEPGALMPVLQEVNAEFRYLPEEALRHVARELKLPLSQVFHVATFYNVFSLEPRGEYIIRVCVGTCCHVKGSGRILDRLQKQLGIAPGETTEDLKFSLETVRCLGCCALAPCVVIGSKTHARLRPDTVTGLVEACR